jgi:hypothetical protein
MSAQHKPQMTISMRTFEYGDGEFGVQVWVTGLLTQLQADKAMEYMQSLLCANEHTVN